MVTPEKCTYHRGLLWQSLTESEVLEKLHTSDNGLTTQEAAIRLNEFGKNELPDPKKISIISIFFGQFRSPLHQSKLKPT